MAALLAGVGVTALGAQQPEPVAPRVAGLVLLLALVGGHTSARGQVPDRTVEPPGREGFWIGFGVGAAHAAGPLRREAASAAAARDRHESSLVLLHVRLREVS